ncbi:putative membrane protein [Trachipleistophora hominis]|uniref:Putative membrane protein n=1 Tax=Trachipleistophora hominis TaxID=72359 RepID=L7JU74_TRAHO|nr:putative membrane protein [Trachipleistophora hominis]
MHSCQFNLLLIVILSFTVIKTFLVLKNDIRIRIDDEFANLQYLIEDSRYKYEINRCGCTDIPAMRRDCMIWKSNMSKSRRDIEVMKIVMDCFGDIVDRFLERISWKFFIFSACLTVIYLIIYRNNWR